MIKYIFIILSIPLVLACVDIHTAEPVLNWSPGILINGKKLELEGGITAETIIDVSASGKVSNVRLVSVKPSSIDESAVIKAVSRSKFQPYTMNGESMEKLNYKHTFEF